MPCDNAFQKSPTARGDEAVTRLQHILVPIFLAGMGDKVLPEVSKSDDEQFEDAQSKEDFNERTVDEVIEQVMGLSVRRPPDSDAEEFININYKTKTICR